MEPINIPDKHQQVMPYFLVKGAEQFFDFIRQTFGATEVARFPDDQGRIRHAEAAIGNTIIMFADSTDTWPPIPGCVFVYVRDADQIYQKGISLGAASVMEPADMDYGRACGIKDPFGNTWWITAV